MFFKPPSIGLWGRIDTVRDGRMCGWVVDSRHPGKRLSVEIYAAGTLLGSARADIFHPDLAKVGIGDGQHAFLFDLPPGDFARESLSARVADSPYWLIDGADDDAVAEPGDAVAADWALSLSDPQAFRHEQQRLAHTWTFLGFTRDVANDGDWFRAALATREVFVQRFGSELRGFENVCRHRHYPIRRDDRGNGPVVCAFHQWQYNRDGLAIGIPKCREVYGKLPHELGARLTAIEVATCGSLVFGRFPSDQDRQSLEDFLADGFPILEALTRTSATPQVLTETVAANWKLTLHITLDDYHAWSVHPKTIGVPDYIPDPKNIVYRRFGVHSAYLETADRKAFGRMVAGCRAGAFAASHYVILQIMPNLVVSVYPLNEDRSYCMVQQFSPIAPDRTSWRAYVYRSPLDAPRAWHAWWTRRLLDPFMLRVVTRSSRLVFGEDRAVCERIQKVGHQIESGPLIGGLERRIAWFEDFYRDRVGKVS